MSYEMQNTRRLVGGKAFNHHQSQDTEQKYHRLRDLARQEALKRQELVQQSQQEFHQSNGGEAKRLSDQAKEHLALSAQYNKQASDFILHENNLQGRVAADTIDLHGQFVQEVEGILEKKIEDAQSAGQTHLHVIVGKGNHSPGHVQKIKPKVEQICQRRGLRYHTEPNEGRIYVNLTGAPVQMDDVNKWGGYQQYGGNQQPYYNQPQGQQGQQGQGQGQDQDQGLYDEIERLIMKLLPRILNKIRMWLCG